MMRTVLVTGGAGYVGAHCCKAFAQAGWRVVVFDNLSRGWRDFVRWGDFIEGDILDQPALEAALREVRPDAVAHFAAFAYIGESMVEPAMYYRNNTAGTLSVLQAMRATGVNNIVFSSTCATYGIARTSRIDETHPQEPVNPYGWSKLVAEQMLADFSRAYGLRYAALRYFNAAGADPEGEIGERHEPETHMIPLAIRGVLDPDYEFVIFGDDFDTRDGSCVRDYIHVTDLASAHCLALDHIMGGGEGGVFNLGTGHGASVLEVAAAIEAAMGRPLKKRVGPRREGDPPTLVAAADRAHAVLGWRPVRSSIQSIIHDAVAWSVKEGETRTAQAC